MLVHDPFDLTYEAKALRMQAPHASTDEQRELLYRISKVVIGKGEHKAREMAYRLLCSAKEDGRLGHSAILLTAMSIGQRQATLQAQTIVFR